MKKTYTVFQLEPLVTPQNWKDEERRFAIHLGQLLERLCQNQNRLMQRIKALEEEKHAQV